MPPKRGGGNTNQYDRSRDNQIKSQQHSSTTNDAQTIKNPSPTSLNQLKFSISPLNLELLNDLTKVRAANGQLTANLLVPRSIQKKPKI
ncbi:unnamed protein product [Rotaria sp. Silwood1]|nr:unnamed protein product [Rotaria sp. Silwood1]